MDLKPSFLPALFLLGTLWPVSVYRRIQTALPWQPASNFCGSLSPFYFVVSAKLAADGILRGMGLMGRFMAATFTDLILRVVLAIVFSGSFGSTGIWMAWPVGWRHRYRDVHHLLFPQCQKTCENCGRESGGLTFGSKIL